VPTLLYRSETWVLNQKDYSILTAVQMVYLRSVKGCIQLDCFHNEDIRQEQNITPIIANTDSYKQLRGEHLLRIEESRILKITFKYNPKGRRDAVHPRKR
jgi:hypothetical protein